VERAYDNRDQRMIDLLRAHGAELDPGSAAWRGHVPIVAPYITGHPERAKELFGACIHGGEPELVRLCLRHAPLDPESDSWGALSSCLWIRRRSPWNKFQDFAATKYVEIMRLLLEAGADANAVGPWGITLLHQTAFAGDWWGRMVCGPEIQVAFAALLLDHGARLDAIDEDMRSTPLGWAAHAGRVDLVRLLLARGARQEVDGQETWSTPLAWAKANGHQEIVALLR
jgi:hypothetical protein